jgi:hypothetical protein
MKKFCLSILTLLLTLAVFAQKKDLMIGKSIKGLYIHHQVAPKETLFGLGRLYNVNPRSIAEFTGIDPEKGLQINQKLRIPLTDTNFTQNGNTGTPLYYITDRNDDLPAMGKKYNDVSLEKLKYWNNLPNDELKEGTKLMVGFLVSKEFPTVTIKHENRPEPVAEKTEPEKTTEPTKPVIEEKPEIKTEIKTEEKNEGKTEEKPQPNPENKPVEKTEEKTATNETAQGYFKPHFDQQIRIIPVSKDETLTAGIFKTSSGWDDAKYYLLMDKVSPGTIVRIINPTNNKAVYAKVLGEMSGIRQNEGLNIRISNAAASALEITETDKFIVKLNY